MYLSLLGQVHFVSAAVHLPLAIATESDFNAMVTNRTNTYWRDKGEHQDCDFFFHQQGSCEVPFEGIADSLFFVLQKNPYHWDETALSYVRQVDAQGQTTAIAALSPHPYVENETISVALLPTTTAIQLAGKHCFFYDFSLSERRGIRTLDTAATVDVDEKGVVYPYELKLEVSNCTQVHVQLNESASTLFIVRAQGHEDGTQLDFTEEDGIGIDRYQVLSLSVALKPGVKVEDARALVDGAIEIGDLTLPVRVSRPYHVVFQPVEQASYQVYFRHASTTVETQSADYLLYLTRPDSCVAHLEVTEKKGYKFVAWMSSIEGGEAQAISLSRSYTGVLNRPQQVVPFIVEDTVPAFVFRNRLGKVYTRLSEALEEARAGDELVMVSSGVVTESCTIPSGVSLCIPKDSSWVRMKDKPEVVYESSLWFEVPTAFMRMTLANGVRLTVEASAELSLGGTQVVYSGGSYYASGSPQGPGGWVYLSEGSQIELKSGSWCYAWGYVYGPGEVIAREGSTLYEMLQLKSWRGGTISEAMAKKPYYLFPFNQYFFQNIESTVVYEANATEYVAMGVYASGAVQTTTAMMVGYGALFEVVDGELERRYWAAQDSMVFTIEGFLYLGELTISSYHSSDYVLSLSSNLHLHAVAGSEIDIPYSLLLEPGGSIQIDEEAYLLLGGEDNRKHAVFVADYESSWKDRYFTLYGDRETIDYSVTLGDTPAQPQIQDAQIVVNGLLETYSLLYTTMDSTRQEGGACICSTGAGEVLLHQSMKDSVTYQVSGLTTPPERLEAVSAQLYNADGTYTKTRGEKMGQEGLSYIYYDHRWVKKDEAGLRSLPEEEHTARKVLIGEQWMIRKDKTLFTLLGTPVD